MRRALLISLALLALAPGTVTFAAGDVRRTLARSRASPGRAAGALRRRGRPRRALGGCCAASGGRELPCAAGSRAASWCACAAASRLRSAVASLRARPERALRRAEPLLQAGRLPNDTRFGELWGLNNSGQSVSGRAGTSDADIDAPEAWNVTKGSTPSTVAVADSGVAYDHPDLQPNIWHNPGESGAGRETNGRDDDHNGLVDDWRGWDFVGDDNDPRDHKSHGSHVAGTIGARGNNAAGMTGVNWQVKLMAVRVADANGVVTGRGDRSQASTTRHATGARVVNASFVSSANSPALLRTRSGGTRRRCSWRRPATAGRTASATDNDSAPQYPCNFSRANVICVAASDQLDRLAEFSNYGRSTVDLAAPGAGVLSALPAYSPPAFSDGFETELAGIWTTGGTNDGWARITTVAHAGSYSLSDSPGTTYLNDTDSFVRTTNPVNLSGQVGCRLSYALRLTTEPGVDRLSIEVSTDGANWTPISDASGSSNGAFLELADDLTRFDGAPVLYIRFRLMTNAQRCRRRRAAGRRCRALPRLQLHRHRVRLQRRHVDGGASRVRRRGPDLGSLSDPRCGGGSQGAAARRRPDRGAVRQARRRQVERLQGAA